MLLLAPLTKPVQPLRSPAAETRINAPTRHTLLLGLVFTFSFLWAWVSSFAEAGVGSAKMAAQSCPNSVCRIRIPLLSLLLVLGTVLVQGRGISGTTRILTHGQGRIGRLDQCEQWNLDDRSYCRGKGELIRKAVAPLIGVTGGRDTGIESSASGLRLSQDR